MAINDPNYRYATQTWEADGVRTQYEIAFDGGYIRQSDVVAFSVLVDPLTGLVTDRTVHTLTFISETVDPETEWKTATVEITPAIALGRRVVIFRSTQKEASLLDYQNDSILTEKNLDLANAQAIFGIAEIMDGLNAASINIQNQTQEIIDISVIIDQVYQEVLMLLASGGIVSVEPLTWFFESTGLGQVEYDIPGATLDMPGFFDVFFETSPGSGDFTALRPVNDFTIDISDLNDPKLILTTAQAEDVRGFATLRGFARPYTGPTPITTTKMRVVTTSSTAVTIGSDYHNTILLCTSSSPVTVTFRKNITDSLDWQDGQFTHVCQLGTGQVTLAVESGGIIRTGTGFELKSRAQYSILTATNIAAAADTWQVAGDTQRTAVTPDKFTFRMMDRSVLSATNITAGTLKDSYILPFGVQLNSIAELGIVANLAVAQAAGSIFTVDILRNGVSIFATPITIDNTEKTSRTAAAAAVFASGGSTLNANDELTLSVTQVGTALAKCLGVTFLGQRTS